MSSPYAWPKARARAVARTSPSTASAASLPATRTDGRAWLRCACSRVPPLTSSAIPPLPCSAAADYEVTAVTRRLWRVPPRKRLALVRADARDAAAVDGAVARQRRRSVSAGGVLHPRSGQRVLGRHEQHHRGHRPPRSPAARRGRHGRGGSRLSGQRLGAVHPGDEPLFMRIPGRTVYADNRRTEVLIAAGGPEPRRDLTAAPVRVARVS